MNIPHNQTRMWHVGPLKFWIHRSQEEWNIAWESNQAQIGSTAARPTTLSRAKLEEMEWVQYVAGKDDTVTVLPQLPSGSVVIRPERPLKILPGKGAQFYFYIPIWIVIQAGGGKSRSTLMEIPTITLSNTWFGAPDTGELALSLDIAMQKECGKSRGPHFTLCPVYIKNSSAGILDFQRLCLRVEHLSLYRGRENEMERERLSTNEVTVNYRGSDQVSQITFLKTSPKNLNNAALVSPPRIPVDKNLLKKSFHFLKTLVD